jgi:DcaP outer membrane protein
MKTTRQTVLATAVYLAVTLNPASAATDAERIRQMERQLEQQRAVLEQQQHTMEAMQHELELMKAGQSAVIETQTLSPADSPPEPAVADTTTTAKPKGLDFDIYGFVMADAIYDFKRVDPDWNDTLRVTTIPTQEGAFGPDGEVVYSVRQSRLGFKADYDTGAGAVSALLEAELYGVGGDAGQTTPRLRHAWATWNNVGVGQYWSNFMDADVFPNTIDYWGPTGMVFYRNKQVRYTWPMGEDEFAVALEDPDTALTVGKFRDECISGDDDSCDSVLGDQFRKWNNVPDLSVRYRNNTGWGHWQLATMARKLGYERRDTKQKDWELGWGINASSVINTTDRDRLRLQVVYGEGIGNYLNDGGVDLAPRRSTLTGNEAVAVPLLGLVAYYDHYWNDRWSSSLGWSTIRLDTTRGQDGDEFEEGQIAQLNLLHYPTDGVLLGGELIWGERDNINGDSGYDLRAQFSLKVSFPR